VILLGLVPFYVYGAFVISIWPLARRLRPVLAGLPPHPPVSNLDWGRSAYVSQAAATAAGNSAARNEKHPRHRRGRPRHSSQVERSRSGRRPLRRAGP
jgi:hypothetical protein